MASFEEKRTTLRCALETHQDELLRAIAVYLRQAGFTGVPSALDDAAREVLSETAATALEASIVDRFAASRGAPVAWLKGIAHNKVRAFLKQRRRRFYREPAAVDLDRSQTRSRPRTQEECLSRLALSRCLRAEGDRVTAVEAVLTGLAPDDRRILSLYYLHGFSGKELAEQLGINTGALYVRLSRARDRARQCAGLSA